MKAQEEEALYQKFVERYEKEHLRNDVLREERNAHNKRYNKERFHDDNDHHVGTYFNGWAQISTLIQRCFGVSSVSRVKGTEDEERADYSGSPAHPGRSSAQPGRASAHLI